MLLCTARVEGTAEISWLLPETKMRTAGCHTSGLGSIPSHSEMLLPSARTRLRAIGVGRGARALSYNDGRDHLHKPLKVG